MKRDELHSADGATDERRRCDDLHLCCDPKCDLILLGIFNCHDHHMCSGPVSALKMKIEWISSLFVICFQLSGDWFGKF